MEDTHLHGRELSLDDHAAPAAKRRKLRKGTQSCWECKRRKARCTFSADTQDVCEGCKRRGTDCISQEATDQPPPPGSNRQLVDRLGQVEALVGQLLKASRSNGYAEDGLFSPTRLASRRRGYRDRPSRSRSPAVHNGTTIFTSEASFIDVLQQDGRTSRAIAYSRAQEERAFRARSTPTTNPTPVHAIPQDAPVPGSHDALCRDLLAAWPSPQDLDIILGLPVETSSIMRAVTCSQVSKEPGGLPSPNSLLRLPPSGCHPVLIARKLLILATFLQGIPSSYSADLEKLTTSCQDIMARVVKTAHDLVTCNDDLVTSLEGIECIMLEGLYENYSGNLRRSWFAARRAVMIAQMLGLNRDVKPPSLTGATIEPDHMWFRLVQFDRYLSMMLGLPQSSLEESFARPEALEPCMSLERMQRLTCVASGRLLQRHPSQIYDSKLTKEIDKMLQDASREMPAQWWVMPTLFSCASHVDRIRETLRFNDQFVHYHLLLQLHLPYLLHSRSEREYDYNRTTAVTASREILSRFMVFRTVQAARYYCRGVDMIAFIASTALCLAHIVCDRQGKETEDQGLHFLAHQRRSDRGVLEQTLAIMQELVCLDNDAIATRVSTLLEYLLAIEEDVAAGGKYKVAFDSDSRKEDLGFRVELNDDNTVLSIYLPHLWVIKVEREGPIKTLLPTTLLQAGDIPQGAIIETGINDTASPIWQNLSLAQFVPLAGERAVEEVPDPNSMVNELSVFENNGMTDDLALGDLDLDFLNGFIEGTAVL
ncbi:zn 2cys6 transcription factor [Fusarium albosuccineum]|uniref:Zn 2cys6 transcription factor n=1 Tax=Fusarium albosuccineum TaxID=1237068 RepID=A0A8H4L146_9HYPO|nr:zn 2cys6 transcription factor [Fusarium albosuccineum]